MSESTHCSSCGGHGYNEEPGEFSNMYTCGDCGGSGSTEGPAVDIEDMAPGTTFVGTLSPVEGSVAEPRTRRMFVTVGPDIYCDRGLRWYQEDIDPSTIHDVTPPTVLAEKE